MKKIVLILLTILTIYSCTKEEELVKSEVISIENLDKLKKKSLIEFNNIDLNGIYNVDKTKLNNIYSILKNYDSNELNKADIKNILGNNYDTVYFNSLDGLLNFSINLYKSNLFNTESTYNERKKYVEEILNYVLLEAEYTKYITLSCGPGYAPCIKKAERTHAVRMAAATASASLGMALVGWTGVGGAASAGGWVIAVVASGVLYQIDSDYCTETNC
jgi:hypothetical protein